MKPVGSFTNREEFYEARGGQWSAERDFGLRNRNDLDWNHGMYATGCDIKVSVVEDTGDVYAQGGMGLDHPVALLGVIDVEACEDVYGEAETLLRPSEEGAGGLPLSWFVERLRCRSVHKAT